MRLVLILALVAMAAAALAAPRPGSMAVPGVSALHSVARLLNCDANAIHQIQSDPGGTGSPQCTTAARQLTR